MERPSDWQKAHQLPLAVYQLTGKFPREEIYGVTSQLRRSSASMEANFREGCGRDGEGKLARFCSIAWGSTSELESPLRLAGDVNLLARPTTEVKRMLPVFLQRLTADR